MRLAARLSLLAMTAATLVGVDVTVGHAAVTYGTPSASAVNPAPDYATSTYASPWTFTTTPSFPRYTGYSTTETVANGQFSFTTATATGFVNLVPYWPGSDATQTDGRKHPINASVYTHVVFRMYSSIEKYGQLTWARCDWTNRSCLGAMTFHVYKGWNSYDLPISPLQANGRPWDATATQPWSSLVYLLRLNAVSQAGVSIKFDYIRLSAATSATVTVPYAGSSTFHLNGPSGVKLTTSNGRVVIPVGKLPSGFYRAYADSGGSYSPTVTVRTPPQPVIDSPGEEGNGDWAVTYRNGDAWDMSQASDFRVENAEGHLDNNVLYGRNGGPDPHDNPIVNLPLGHDIDANKWHRLSFRIRYDGPFGLNGGFTGGCIARFIWQVRSAPGKQQQSQDFVIYPGWQTVVVDLRRSPSSSVTDETQNTTRIGWAGQTVYSARLDPNEDQSKRFWYLDSVRLAYNPLAAYKTTMTFHDNAWVSGQTATVYLSTSRSPSTHWTAVRTNVPVASGSNRIVITAPPGMAAGNYYVVLRTYDPKRTTSTVAYSTAPINFSMVR